MPDYIIMADSCGNCGNIDTEAECPANCILKLDSLTPELEAELEQWCIEQDKIYPDFRCDPGCNGDFNRCDCR
jgi:hypothetical protein